MGNATFADLASGILKTVEREIPALGCTLFIKELSTGEFEKLQAIDDDNQRVASFFCAGITDADGGKMTKAQATSLMSKNSFKSIKQIMAAIMSVSGVGEEDESGEN